MDEALVERRHSRETFASSVKEATGRWGHAGVHWRAFSDGFTYAVAREEAHVEYRARWLSPDGAAHARELLLLPHQDERLAWRCVALQPPQRSGSEYLVCPPDFSWTMGFTREDGWPGPYFTTAEWAQRQQPRAPRGRWSPRRR